MATMLTKAISFRSLIKQLSKYEFLTFMSKIYDINHSDLIAKSLFNYFIDGTNPNADDLNNINSILSEIIQSRKPKPKPQSESIITATIKLDILPTALIGNIASYA
eukprot:136840_1